MEGFLWGAPTSKPQAVIMTEDHARTLITQIVKEVTTRNDGDVLETYKQLARLEIELARARDEIDRVNAKSREEIERKDAEIAALRAHIENIQRFMTAVPAAVAGQMPMPYAPYNNNASQPWTPPIVTTQPVPMWDQRPPVPMPLLPSPPAPAPSPDQEG